MKPCTDIDNDPMERCGSEPCRPPVMSRPSPRRAAELVILMVLMLAAGWSAHAQMRDYAPGTVRMIITYRCRAIDRPPFLAAMRKEGASRFESWKKEGVLSDYLLLFNTVCDTGTWDMMAILSFDTYQQTMRWYQVEESYPAGLSRELLALATPTTSQLAESRWSFGPPKDRRSAIYMIIPYDHPDRDVYANFVDAVLVPQFDGWMKEGALGAWSIMLTMHYPGKPHDIWLLLEYNGIDGLTHRNGARAATAERLEQQPDWRLLRGISEGFRSEHEVTIARAIVPE